MTADGARSGARSGARPRGATVLAAAWLAFATPLARAQDAPAPEPPALEAAAVDPAAVDPAAVLRARHAALVETFAHSPFGQPLHVESSDEPRRSAGDAYGIVEHPLAVIATAVSTPARWCDMLILHLNVKSCRAGAGESGDRLAVAVGRKRDRALSSASRVEFVYRIATSRPDYVNVVLEAARGPLGTRDYRIELEAVPLDDARTFVHMRYAFRYGAGARFAMRLYLATEGSGKVGFTSVGHDAAGKPRLIGGVRGAIERNVMRYYLAADACLAVQSLPEPERFEASLDHWFSATERYPRQLRELDRDEYFALKRRDRLR